MAEDRDCLRAVARFADCRMRSAWGICFQETVNI